MTVGAGLACGFMPLFMPPRWLTMPKRLTRKDWEKSIAANTRATGMLIPMVEPLSARP